MLEAGWEQRVIRANGVELRTVLAGPSEGPLVVLLHGFPDGWFGWRAQIRALAGAGFRVAVPDQRGYGGSAKPRGVAAYRLAHLAGDVVGLIAALGRDRAAIVGHDWGAAVAWWVATRHPSWTLRLAILNVPHPAVMVEQLRRSAGQRRRSWYIAFFQLPWLPEALARLGDGRLGVAMLRASSRSGTFPEEELAAYRAAWREPGATTAMLNWYRAAVRFPIPAGLPTVTPPTLILWGERDVALEPELATRSLAICARGRLVTFPEAGHWVQREEAARVNEELVGFLGEGG